VATFKAAWQESPVKAVVAHVPYLVNLASPDKSLWQKSTERLRSELCRAQQFGVACVVLHPGSAVTSSKKAGMKRIVEAIDLVLDTTNESTPTILLETMSGQGTMIGSRFEEIAHLLEAINQPERLGVCFDTAHVFMAGYDLRGDEGYTRVLEEFDNIIGVEKIHVLHVNDSKTPLGSRVDRHACIGEGELGVQVFRALMNDARFLHTPKILETPERDTRSQENLELLRSLQTIAGYLPRSHDVEDR
jgi:deoxyribonuclease-4